MKKIFKTQTTGININRPGQNVYSILRIYDIIKMKEIGKN
jgi:hypothetical protein